MVNTTRTDPGGVGVNHGLQLLLLVLPVIRKAPHQARQVTQLLGRAQPQLPAVVVAPRVQVPGVGHGEGVAPAARHLPVATVGKYAVVRSEADKHVALNRGTRNPCGCVERRPASVRDLRNAGQWEGSRFREE